MAGTFDTLKEFAGKDWELDNRFPVVSRRIPIGYCIVFLGNALSSTSYRKDAATIGSVFVRVNEERSRA